MLAATATEPPIFESVALALPRVDPETVHWSRALHDARLGRLIVDRWPGIVLAPATAPPIDAECYAIKLTDGENKFCVEISGCGHPALAMAARQPDCVGTQRLTAAIFCAAHLEMLHKLGLGQWTPTGMTRVNVGPAHPENKFASAWIAVLENGRCLCTLRIACETSSPRRRLQALIDGQMSCNAHLVSFAVPGRIVLHQHAYPVKLFSSLALGDVLLMQPIPDSENGLAVHVQWGSAVGRFLQTKAILKANQMQIQAAPSLTADENLQDVAVIEQRALESIDDLTIPVRFEIETVAIALGDIASIRPGYVIELNTPIASAAIRLVACGQVIGHAEIVAVGGQLGARITHMVER